MPSIIGRRGYKTARSPKLTHHPQRPRPLELGRRGCSRGQGPCAIPVAAPAQGSAKRPRLSAMRSALRKISRAGSGGRGRGHVSRGRVASVVDGKIRLYPPGLGDRLQLGPNSTALRSPNADPDKRSGPPWISSPLRSWDNIVTTKSFTPDKPGGLHRRSRQHRPPRRFPDNFTLSVLGLDQIQHSEFVQRPIPHLRGAAGLDWIGGR